MANVFRYSEVRVLFEPERVQVYVKVDEVDGPAPEGFARKRFGWHHRTYPATLNWSELLLMLFTQGHYHPVEWAAGEPPNYQRMAVSEMLTACGDDPERWSDAYLQTMPKDPSRHEVAEFFRDMLEVAADTRRARAAECGPKGDR